MRIAIPISNGRLHSHFGHCPAFAFVDIDPDAKTVLALREVAAPEHQPGLLPVWLRERGANLVIAGNMGSRARALFEAASVAVVTGAPEEEPQTLVREYLAGTLVTHENNCDH
ncbi:MAG: NifB/NifX family molybdenum-iron cluster-binding protein [Acidobacteriota bacterium]